MCLGLGKVTCPATLWSFFLGVPTMTSVKRSMLTVQVSWGGVREELHKWHSRFPPALCLNYFPFPGSHNYSLRWNRIQSRLRATCRRSCYRKEPPVEPHPPKVLNSWDARKELLHSSGKPVKINDFLAGCTSVISHCSKRMLLISIFFFGLWFTIFAFGCFPILMFFVLVIVFS